MNLIHDLKKIAKDAITALLSWCLITTMMAPFAVLAIGWGGVVVKVLVKAAVFGYNLF